MFLTFVVQRASRKGYVCPSLLLVLAPTRSCSCSCSCSTRSRARPLSPSWPPHPPPPRPVASSSAARCPRRRRAPARQSSRRPRGRRRRSRRRAPRPLRRRPRQSRRRPRRLPSPSRRRRPARAEREREGEGEEGEVSETVGRGARGRSWERGTHSDEEAQPGTVVLVIVVLVVVLVVRLVGLLQEERARSGGQRRQHGLPRSPSGSERGEKGRTCTLVGLAAGTGAGAGEAGLLSPAGVATADDEAAGVDSVEAAGAGTVAVLAVGWAVESAMTGVACGGVRGARTRRGGGGSRGWR